MMKHRVRGGVCLLLLGTVLGGCGPAGGTPTAVGPAGTAAPAATAASTPTAPPATAAPTAPATAAPVATQSASTPGTPTGTFPEAPAFERGLQVEEPRLEGVDVGWAQRRLLALGYDAGPEDGIYGPQTEQAVRAFQSANGLQSDGIVGPETWARLNDLSAVGQPGTATDLTVLVDGATGLIIGAVRAGEWLSGGVAGQLVTGPQTYIEYSLAGPGLPFDGQAPQLTGAPCTADTYAIPELNGVPALFVGGTVPAQPRGGIPLPTNDPSIAARLTELISENGIDSPQINVTAAISADLDGDGTDETVVSASALTTEGASLLPSPSAGNYSLVAVLPGQEDPQVLIGAFYPTTDENRLQEEYRLLTVLDLNGDGMLDIVVGSRYYEGSAAGVFSMESGAFKEVLSWGCGA